MAVTFANKKSVNQLLIIITGVIIVVAAILIYLFILRGVFGRFSSDELLPDAEAFKNLLLGREPGVAILYSDYTQNMLTEGSTWQEDNIATWEKFLKHNNDKFIVLSDEQIERGKHFEFEMLVLPGSISLSDREIIQIKKFLDEGFEVSLEIDPKGPIGKRLAKLDGVVITEPKLHRVDTSKTLEVFTDR